MLYEVKQETKAYEYIKGILDAEEKEYQAYMYCKKAIRHTHRQAIGKRHMGKQSICVCL